MTMTIIDISMFCSSLTTNMSYFTASKSTTYSVSELVKSWFSMPSIAKIHAHLEHTVQSHLCLLLWLDCQQSYYCWNKLCSRVPSHFLLVSTSKYFWCWKHVYLMHLNAAWFMLPLTLDTSWVMMEISGLICFMRLSLYTLHQILGKKSEYFSFSFKKIIEMCWNLWTLQWNYFPVTWQYYLPQPTDHFSNMKKHQTIHHSICPIK